MQHIARIVWKPINWVPESPEQYPDHLPIWKPEALVVELSDERWLQVTGLPLGDTVKVELIGGEKTHLQVLSIPADRVHDVVDALLYIHRRTHEHEYQGPDAGLPDEPPA